jgi:hypothetical protein
MLQPASGRPRMAFASGSSKATTHGRTVLLSGIGFAVLAIGGALRNPQTALTFLQKRTTANPAATA